MNTDRFEIYLNNSRYLIMALISVLSITWICYFELSMEDPKWGRNGGIIIAGIFILGGIMSFVYLAKVVKQKKPIFVLCDTHLECNTPQISQHLNWCEIDFIRLIPTKDKKNYMFSISAESKKFKFELDTRFLKLAQDDLKDIFQKYGGKEIWN